MKANLKAHSCHQHMAFIMKNTGQFFSMVMSADCRSSVDMLDFQNLLPEFQMTYFYIWAPEINGILQISFKYLKF